MDHRNKSGENEVVAVAQSAHLQSQSGWRAKLIPASPAAPKIMRQTNARLKKGQCMRGSQSQGEEHEDPRLLRKTLAYKRAFEAYMRSGEPIRLDEVKARAKNEERTTTHYVWRTRGDGKVRPSHRANDGKIFARDDPPPTGHPGEDYGCRCWAEAYTPDVEEYARQRLVSAVNDAGKKWDTGDFVWHALFGGGAPVSLSEMGLLQDVVDLYAKNRYGALNQQIIEAARQAGSGRFSYDFNKSYTFFSSIHPAFGGGTVSGEFKGTAELEDNILNISGTVEYYFSDEFTDPFNIREDLFGTSSPERLNELLVSVVNLLFARARAFVRQLAVELEEALKPHIDVDLDQIARSAESFVDAMQAAREFGLDVDIRLFVLATDLSIRYPIIGTWQTEFEARALAAPK